MARGKRKREASSMAGDDEQLEADASAGLSGVLMPKARLPPASACESLL